MYFCFMIELPVIPANESPRKPDWLRVKLPVGKEYAHVRSLVDTHKVATAQTWANAGVLARPPS